MADTSPPLSLGGNLADFPLADVLTFLNMGMKTGAIEVRSGNSINRVYLGNGEVIFATSLTPRFTLPGFLVARGHIAEAAAVRLKDQADREGIPFRDIVIRHGYVDASEMISLEKILCCEIAFEAIKWRVGKFAFLADRKPDATATPIKIGVQNLIMEGARRLDEAMRFEHEAQIDRDMVVTLVCATGRLEEQVVLTPAEWGVISLINGKRTLDEIFALSPTSSDADAWSVLQRLQSARLIQIHKRGDSVAPEPSLTVDVPEPSGTELLQRAVVDSDRPTVVGMRSPLESAAEKTDIRLISGDEVTTSHGMYGRRLPARLVAASDTKEPVAAFDLARPILTLGRAGSNDIVLPHQSVSKQHAKIIQDDDGWRVIDLQSTNGIRVNEQKVDEARLQPGDRVQIGAYMFEFDAVGLR